LIGAVVVAVVIAGVTGVRAQLLRLPSVMPGRAGTGSFLWFDRAFPDLEFEIVANQNFTDRQVEVSALLYFHNERFGHCFVAPDGLRVAVNGHVLEVAEPGHENRHRRESDRDDGWNGFDYNYSSLFPCTAAAFKSRKGETIETDRPVTATLDLGSKHAEMSSATFFQPRRLVLRSARTARAGDTVILDRQPRSDDLIESTPSIRLERSTWETTELFPRDGVKYAAGTWRFALPRLARGRYKVHANLSGSDLAVVDTCRGVHRCLAQVPSSTYQPVPELDVIE
jgi:hypothetical protein